MRIASISKALTSLIAARLIDRGVLDLDAPIRSYLQDLSPHQWDGRQVRSLSLDSIQSALLHFNPPLSHVYSYMCFR